MPDVEVQHLSYAYRKVDALHDVDFAVAEGALYALLGPNGSGKTTLLQILMGLRRARRGRVSLLGVDSRALTVMHRSRIGYIAEGQALPGWMRLEQLEAYLAPVHPGWDPALAAELRERFALDARRKINTLSRGERMKAALLCALAPRPKLLLMDEPFTGMDALVKDDLVRGLLGSAGRDGSTILICSHDIGELEMLADWVGFLQGGRLQVSEPMERVRSRFRRVTVVADEATLERSGLDASWLAAERAGRRLTFLTSRAPAQQDAPVPDDVLERFAGADRIDVAEASLREIFVALARATNLDREQEVAA